MRRSSRSEPRGERIESTGWAALVVAVMAVVCCAALPMLVGVIGGLAIGAALGILVGELLVHWIGRGTWQLMLVVVLAVASARFVRLPGLALTQAVTSGVLLVAVVPVTGDVDPALARFVSALIGGLVGLATIVILPSNPVRELDRGITDMRNELARILDDLADAMRVNDQA